MVGGVYINREADPYVLETDGTLYLAGLSLQPASIVINRSATSSTVSSNYSTGTGCHMLWYAGRGAWWMPRQANPSGASQTFSRMFCMIAECLHDPVAGSKGHRLQITGTSLAGICSCGLLISELMLKPFQHVCANGLATSGQALLFTMLF